MEWQNHTFCLAKGMVLQGQTYGFALQKVTFRFPPSFFPLSGGASAAGVLRLFAWQVDFLCCARGQTAGLAEAFVAAQNAGKRFVSQKKALLLQYVIKKQ